MIKESIVELISAIADGDTLAIEDSFNSVMASKISDRLDSMRVDVAQGMFGSVVEESVDESTNWAAHNARTSARKEASPEELHAEFKKYANNPGHHYYKGKFSDDKDGGKTAEQKAITNIALGIGKADKQNYAARISHLIKPKATNEELTLEDYSVEELEDFMMSEDFEQLDELSRKTLSSYIGKARSSKSNALKDYHKAPEGSDEREKIGKKANNRTDGKERAIDTLRGKTNKDRAKKGLPTRYYTEELELDEAVTASQLIANHNSSDHGGAQHFSNVDGKHHSWNYVKKNKEGTKYEVTTDKNEAEGIAHKGKFLKLKK